VSRSAPISDHWPSWVTMLVLVVVAGTLTAVAAVTNHRNFGTALFDLAVYDNVLWQTSHGRWLGSSLIPGGYHLGTHVDPILVFLAPVYRLWPRAETLLVIQSFWLVSGAVPLFLLARRVFDHGWLAVGMGASLLLHPALHGPLFYDFHSLSLAGPLFLWVLHFLGTGNRRAYLVTAALLLLTREDMAILLVPVGVFAWQGGERGLSRTTIAGALLYLALVKYGLALWGQADGNFAYYYEDLVTDPDGHFGHLLLGLVLHPLRALEHVLGAPRLAYMALMFGPLLFLPFVARRGRYLLAYGLAATLLASRGAMHSVHFQYTTFIYPFAFALVPAAIVRLTPDVGDAGHRRRRIALVSAVVLACLVTGLRFGALAPNPAFRAGYTEFRPRPDKTLAAEYRDLAQIRDTIPGNAVVAASWHVAPHVSNRRDIHHFPDGWGCAHLLVHRTEMSDWRQELLDYLENAGAYRLEATGLGGLEHWLRVDKIPLPVQPERSKN